MTTFFSGTDTAELHDNAPHYPYYLSLIVNHKSQYCAKIAMIGTNNNRISLKQDQGSFQIVDQEVLVIIDMEIEIEQDVEFKTLVAKLLEPKPRRITHYSSGEYSIHDFRREFANQPITHLHDDELDDVYGSSWVDRTFTTITTSQAREFLAHLIAGKPKKGELLTLDMALSKANREAKATVAWAKNLMGIKFDKVYADHFDQLIDYEDVLETCASVLKPYYQDKCGLALLLEIQKELQTARKESKE